MARMAVNPFKSSPDPKYLYLTSSLEEACEKTRYVIDEKLGLTLIYGEIGHGKSTLLRYLYGEYSARPDVEVALIPNPDYETGLALVKAICGEFGVARKRAKLDQQNELQAFLLDLYEQEKNCVVFIDEAQIIQGRVLELIRLLLNLDTDLHKLMQIVLAGQLELRDRLRDPTKKALRSRIFITSTLDPLNLEETLGLVEHRCKVAGKRNPFPPETIEAIWSQVGGIPREVLKFCGTTWDVSERSGYSEVPPEAVAHVAADIEG